jgi:hypothetical protein
MKASLIIAVAWLSLCGNPAIAQVSTITGAPASLGVTSPLGIGPGAPVGATGIPLGATELPTPGVSPAAAGTSALGSMTAASTCSGIGASAQPPSSSPGNPNAGTSMAGASTVITGATIVPTPLFDSIGVSGTASGTCASGITTASSNPTASASSPALGTRSAVGRVGIPMGSTELATGGISPLPDITLPSQLPVVPNGTNNAPCLSSGSSSTTAASMPSGSC